MCELYLSTPLLDRVAGFMPVLKRALEQYQPAALLLRLAPMGDEEAQEQLAILQSFVQEKQIALILENKPELACQTGCDGVHLSLEYPVRSVQDVRRLLGEDRQLGVAAGLSRDKAMCAGEDGADYVSFESPRDYKKDPKQEEEHANQVVSLVQWWSEMMELPVVACAHTPYQRAVLAISGADFFMPDEQWWEVPTPISR
ncbi:MAG: thiamine phosphate synthase [Acetobacter sp.]|nr:thiamine phosphate synthase [Acetobacter sp.]